MEFSTDETEGWLAVIIAEDLLLLLMDDERGRPITDGTKLDHALAGAVLLELALAGRVDAVKGNGWLAAERLVIVDATPTNHPVLDAGLEHIRAKEGRKPQNVLGAMSKGLRVTLLDALARRGILTREENRVLGIFPTTSWPAADVAHEGAVRERLHAVLVQGLTPQARDGALISLLSAIDVVPKVIEGDRGQLKRRAKEIAEQEWASAAVKKAVEAVNAAVAGAIVAAAGAAAAGGS